MPCSLTGRPFADEALGLGGGPHRTLAPAARKAWSMSLLAVGWMSGFLVAMLLTRSACAAGRNVDRSGKSGYPGRRDD
jgi:hypothetical protein